ncbi:MAG TPA: pseudaminic acid synthase [Lachnospiraceae bacterium]|nr:pseudaminic acid synthase [Lachnospiraceae bacterium]
MNLFETIKIGNVYVIAEMSANHAGKLENALQIVQAAKKAGADCLKIQTYTADTLTLDCDNECFKIKEGLWTGNTLYNLYKQAYTPWEWQAEIKSECERLDMDFLSTPFDSTAVDFLEGLGIEFYKIASFELIDIPLIEYVANKGKPIIMSTGMASFEEIEDAVSACKRMGNEQIVLLRCSSSYPAISDDMNLQTMVDMGLRFGVPVGLSDHSMGSVAAIAAVALGASVIEKHFCLSRLIENPDSSFSMEPAEFKQMVMDVQAAKRSIGSVCYGPTQAEIGNLRFRRSIFSTSDISRGEFFSESNIRCIRPSHGMKPKYFKGILGKQAKVDIPFGTPIHEDLIG